MPRKIWNDGMEMTYADLSAASSALELEMYDRVLYELMKRQQNVVFGDSFSVTYVNATTVAVKLGNGMYYDNTQVDPEPMTRLLRVATNTNQTLAAADGSHNRIDIVCITPARATSATASRNQKDPNTGVVTLITQNIETDWVSTLSVVSGTPASSPAVPATPAGAIKLAEVLVVATSGLANQAGITDKRPRFRLGGWSKVTAVTTTYIADQDDDVITANAAGGSFAVTLPTAASCFDSTTKLSKKVTVINIGASGTVTVTGNGSENISDSNTQAIATQYGALTMASNGTQWYLID